MLNRSIGRWTLVLFFINGVIGSGIFGLPSKVFKEVGVYSIAAFLVCAVAVFIIVLCFAEVSSRFDKTGGPYVYALASFGRLPAFLTGWLLLVTRIITYAALINLLVTYLAVFSSWFALPSSRLMVILSLTAILAFINHIGVKNSTAVNNVLTIGKLLPLLLFIAVGLAFIVPANFEIKQVPSFSTFSSTVLLLVFAFGGFESVLVNSGEVKNPASNLPFALLLATGLIALIYILVQVVSIGTLPGLANSSTPLADSARLFIGKTGAAIIAIGAVVSVIGTLNAIMLVGSRLPFAFSEEKQFPGLFSFVHPKWKTPTWSLLLFAGITALASINYNFLSAASLSAITRVIIYAIVCIALIMLRKKDPAHAGYFKLRFGVLLAVLGLVITIWLLTNSGMRDLGDIGIALGIGLIIYFLVMISSNRVSRLD